VSFAHFAENKVAIWGFILNCKQGTFEQISMELNCMLNVMNDLSILVICKTSTIVALIV